MRSRIYCSYFDHRYLAKGLAMIRSLRRQVPGAEIWVLCLSAEAEAILSVLKEPGVNVVTLGQVEAGDAELAAAKVDGRSALEYYFTLTPSLVLYVLHRTAADIVTYLDGDLWFFADPEPIYHEMRDASVLIIPHRFTPAMKHLEKFGVYNVGWVSFRNDLYGRECAEWWRERNNEWCFDYLDNGRFADQKYLDDFPRLFRRIHILEHLGANVAPWNVDSVPLTLGHRGIRVGSYPLLFFHFHGLKTLLSGETLTAHGYYKSSLAPLVRDAIYVPYLREVDAIARELGGRFGNIAQGSVRDLHGSVGSGLKRFKAWLKLLRARRRGWVIPALNDLNPQS